MPRAKFLSKEDILQAMSKTKSARAAARFLHVSFNHFRKYAKLYKDEESGLTLLEKHKNPSGRGIPKYLGNKKEPLLLDIIEGRVPHYHFTLDRIKQRLILEGMLEERCDRCGFTERRVLDLKVPLILHFRDGVKTNLQLKNLCFLCYNCYFLYIDNIFTSKQITALEDYNDSPVGLKPPTFELDDYMIERLKEIGIYEEEARADDPYDLVSYQR